MNFAQMFLLYFMTLAVLTAVDLIWRFLISRRLYRIHLEGLLRAKFNIIPAVLFYIMIAFGLLIFVISPAFNNSSLGHAIGMGVLFGLFSYGAFSLTNRALLRNWTQLIMLTDIFRGIIVCGAASTVAYYVSQSF